MKKKIIITGSSGNVSNYFYEFLKKKYDVIRLSRNQNLKDKIFYNNTNKISKQNIFFLIHISSYSPQSNSKNEQRKSYLINKKLDNNILKIISKNTIQNIIYFSSTSVYSDIEKGKIVKKSQTYGYGKLLMEKKLSNLNSNSYILRIPSLLYKNGLGNWINKICKKLRFNKDITISNPNNLYNNCVDIHKLYEIVDAIIKKNKPKSENLIFHPCSRNPIKIKEIIKLLLQKYNKYDGKIKEIKFNLKRQLNKNNDIDLLNIKQDTVKKTIKKFLDNEFSYEKILVVGSKGYIGSNIIKYKFRGKITGISSKNYKFEKKNYKDKIKKIIEKSDLIIFLLQKNSKKNFIRDNDKLILNFLKNTNYINKKKILYISTTSKTKDEYATMHYKRENIIKKYSNNNYLILKIPSIYGGSNIKKINFGVNGFINKAKKNRNINLKNSGLNIRTHLYIGDFLKIFEKILNYNLCGSYTLPIGDRISFIKLLSKINKISNTKITNIFGKNMYPKKEILKDDYIKKYFNVKTLKIDKYIKEKLQ